MPSTHHRRLRSLLALLGGLALASATPSAARCPDVGLERILPILAPGIDHYVLDNGLRVVLAPRAGERTVAVRVAYDVGARDEPEGRAGVAHLFEHMMFKGSGNVPDGGHFRLVRDTGGRTNAATDYDTTEYWDTVPVAALERVLFAEADRMRRIGITEANLDNQRAAIQEEGLGLENLPYVAAAADFGLELWSGTPYGHSPIGTDEELAAVRASEARRFHARYYTPGNAVLVLVGGFDPDGARRAIDRFFAPIPRGADRPRREPFRVDRRPLHVVADDPLAPFPVYAVVWHGVGSREPDALPLAVIDTILMGHPNARLERAIRGPLALDAYSVSFAFRDVGLLNFVFAPRTFASFDDIQETIREEVRSLRAEGPSAEELCESRRRVQSMRLDALSTNEGVGAAVARGVLFHGDPRHFETELERLDTLDADDVRRVAERHLDDDFSTLEIRPVGLMGWLKPILEVLPSGVGAGLEGMLL
jgi:predicted Zn-dependent peptidase